MKTYPFFNRNQFSLIEKVSKAIFSPFRLIGWVLGVIFGSFLAGILQGWEDVR